ncbi:MAG: hypothetical protein LBQ87_03780 [Candidatus Fibromonas sp.]|jgi:uncharacterized protein (TIGR02145 family)|nr:hypothetical protein [Candidatus Fibromonas sp.]
MKKILLFAMLAFATGLLFSCASEDESGESPSSSSTGEVSSSSVLSVQGSSSSVTASLSSSSTTTSPVSSSSDVSLSSSSAVVVGGDNEPVSIGTQVWMKRNLDVEVEGSKCYDNDPENCAKYGRLYNWATAMNLPSDCNSRSCSSQIQAKHQGICPSGWHIPSNEDWDKLYRFADGSTGTESPYDSPTAGGKLKATSLWNDYNGESGNGTDEFGFSALPGGRGDSNGGFVSVGYLGYWWSASEDDYLGSGAYSRVMVYDGEGTHWNYDDELYLFSVRCLQD